MQLEYFQMVDRIVEVNLDERRIRTECIVPKASTVFEGHFPTYPLMPGVLLIECMAQTGGWLVAALAGFDRLAILAGVKQAKFRAPVLPGDVLECDGKVVHEGSGYAVAEAKGLRTGAVVCEAQLTYRIIPFPSEQLRQTFRDGAARLGLPLKEPTR
jgi:3-hydroxyacyl-[acyl-carrier-protein] dehydratase